MAAANLPPVQRESPMSTAARWAVQLHIHLPVIAARRRLWRERRPDFCEYFCADADTTCASLYALLREVQAHNSALSLAIPDSSAHTHGLPLVHCC